MVLNAGSRFGPYEVTGPLGTGGMGEVYRARDTELGRDVAIKVLPAAFASDAARVARFEQEAKTLAALNHARIAQIYGLARNDGTTALAMELVEGPTLLERLARGALPVEEALDVAGQIADALEAAHERGIVHRDLKPGNIKITPGGAVKVLDFGIAKALDTRQLSGPGPAALTTPAQTEAGFVLGTAAYMSPEQARGKLVDQRTDIWAFGCVLYEMLTGEAAFLGEDVTSTLARVLEVSPNLRALPARVSPAVRRTLELCLEKDARKRLSDMRDVRLALGGAFTPAAAAPPLWRRALPFAATLVLGVVLAGIYALSQRPAAAPATATAAPQVSRFVIMPPATAPLTNAGDLDLTISPDGQRIAYWAQQPDSNSIELYVRELDALDARAVPGTAQELGAARNVFFSPDGNSIGYRSPGGLVSIGLDGRPPVKIADFSGTSFTGAWWAPDNSIVFSSGPRLERVSAAGGATPEPLMPVRLQGGVAGPVVLPGGRAVLFHATADAAGDRVAVLDLETGEEKTVIDGGSNPAYLDTGHLVFARGDTLMAVPFDASELATTGEAVALVQGVRRSSGGATDFALSANGTLVYVPGTAETETRMAVVWVDRTGQTMGRAVRELVDNPRDPRLSPDGQRLLLVTGPENDGDLWVHDLRDRPAIPLALAGDNRVPAWSPDGRQVAFLSLGSAEVRTLAADGSERVPRSLRPEVLAPQVWSVTGDLILTRPGDILVTATGSSTGEVRPLVATDSVEGDPALSPDGGWLAYVSNRTGRGEIWVQPYPEGVPVRVSSGGAFEPQWSTDGRELFYRNGNAVMAISVQPGAEFSFAAPQTLFSGQFIQRPGPAGRGWAVAPDGRFVMLVLSDDNVAPSPASIVVVQNFAEEIKRRVRPSGP